MFPKLLFFEFTIRAISYMRLFGYNHFNNELKKSRYQIYVYHIDMGLISQWSKFVGLYIIVQLKRIRGTQWYAKLGVHAHSNSTYSSVENAEMFERSTQIRHLHGNDFVTKVAKKM